MPNSVPMNSRFGFTGSSAMAYTEPRSGRLPLIIVQVLPASVLFTAIRFEVAVLVIVVKRVNRVGVVLGSKHAMHVTAFGHVQHLFDFAPGLAAVFGDVEQAVVRADVNQAFFLRRFAHRRAVAVERGGLMFGDGVRPPDFAEDRQGCLRSNPRDKIAADDFPVVAAIVAAEEFVTAEVQPFAVVRADDQRENPSCSAAILRLCREWGRCWCARRSVC
jgi:hypothetical protein